VVIRYTSDNRETYYTAKCKHFSNDKTETEAPMKDVSLIEDSSEDVSAVVFLTDALSVMEAMTSNKSPE
jgi:hypothetical protein